MQIYNLPLGPIETNSYVVLPEDSEGAILIDAPEGASVEIPAFLKKKGRKLTAILLTHGHWDHMWDASALKDKTGAKIYAHSDGKTMIETEGAQSSYMFGEDSLQSAKIDVYPKDGDILEVEGVKIKCLYAPGHCAGSLVYFFGDETPPKAFVGDVIFEGSIGRYDLPTGNYAKLEKSIREKIYTLPDDTILLPGHGPSTTVGAEKVSNQYVRA